MPALEQLFAILVTKVIPAVQTFLAENGDKLVGVMTGALKAIVGFGYAVFKVFQFVAKHKTVFHNTWRNLGSDICCSKSDRICNCYTNISQGISSNQSSSTWSSSSPGSSHRRSFGGSSRCRRCSIRSHTWRSLPCRESSKQCNGRDGRNRRRG
jgi:hypothetical protein